MRKPGPVDRLTAPGLACDRQVPPRRMRTGARPVHVARRDTVHEPANGRSAFLPVALVATFLVAGCGIIGARPPRVAPGDAHLIVDCLLPPRMVSEANLGAVALPRPPAKTTAADCLEQGGTYRTADPQWPLTVWLPRAERGDAEAEYHVGEFYERGLQGVADFASAARWYRL